MELVLSTWLSFGNRLSLLFLLTIIMQARDACIILARQNTPIHKHIKVSPQESCPAHLALQLAERTGGRAVVVVGIRREKGSKKSLTQGRPRGPRVSLKVRRASCKGRKCCVVFPQNEEEAE